MGKGEEGFHVRLGLDGCQGPSEDRRMCRQPQIARERRPGQAKDFRAAGAILPAGTRTLGRIGSMTEMDRHALEILRAAVPDVVAVYRFGSTSSGAAGPESDVDLAVLALTRLDAQARFELQGRLASVFRRPVDLVDLRAASTVMAMQVVGSGTVLYENDTAERARFEDLTYSLYARLNEERRGILDRVAREGAVYGR